MFVLVVLLLLMYMLTDLRLVLHKIPGGVSKHSTNTVTASKKTCFILFERSDFCMIDNLSIVVNLFAWCILPLFSGDEMLLLRYVNWSTNSSGLPIIVEIAPSCWKQIYSVFFTFRHISIRVWLPTIKLLKVRYWLGNKSVKSHLVKVKVSCRMLQAMQLRFCLGSCICEKRKIICVVCACLSFCGISFASWLLKCETIFCIRSIEVCYK